MADLNSDSTTNNNSEHNSAEEETSLKEVVQHTEHEDSILSHSQNTPLINELLCFIFNKIQSIPYEVVCKLCSDFYSEAVVEKAKDMLFNTLSAMPMDNLPRKIKRRGAQKKQNDLQDILNLFLEMPPNMAPVFVVQDLTNLPPISLDTFDMSGIIKDLEDLKIKVRILQEAQEANLMANLALADKAIRNQPESEADWSSSDLVSETASGTAMVSTSEPASEPSETPSERAPELAPKPMPETRPKTAPEAAPETTPKTTRETSPETAPETAPEIAPETTPETAPEPVRTPRSTAPPQLLPHINPVAQPVSTGTENEENEGEGTVEDLLRLARIQNLQNTVSKPTYARVLGSRPRPTDTKKQQNKSQNKSQNKANTGKGKSTTLQLASKANSKPQNKAATGRGTSTILRPAKRGADKATTLNSQNQASVFVTRLNRNTKPHNVVRHIENETGLKCKCEPLKTKFNDYKSFRVYTSQHLLHKLLDPMTWPAGVLYMEFEEKK